MVLVPLVLGAGICRLAVHQGASVPALWTWMQEVVGFGSPAKAGGPTGDISFPLTGHTFGD